MRRSLLAVTCATLLVACNDVNEGTSADETQTPAGNAGTPAPGAGLQTLPSDVAGIGGVDITLNDGSITLANDSTAPGVVSLRVHNGSSGTHRFRLTGNGEEIETEDLAPGGEVTMTMNLTAGTYQLSCPVDGHATQGEQATLRVR